VTKRTRILRILLPFAALAVAPTSALSFQEGGALPPERLGPGGQITIGQKVSIPSAVFGGDREILVYLPDDYSWSGERYPVVYLLDGSFFFLPTAGLVDFYSTINRMPKMIVVAVVHWDRMAELSTGSSGRAGRFPSFLRQELIPYVDGHFRTEPFRILVGHSLGGLFSAHSLFAAPDLFQAHIAASPALYWDGGSELDRARKALESDPNRKNHLYLTYSEGDGSNIRRSTDSLVGLLEESGPSGLSWEFQFLPHDRHNSSPVPSVLGGLRHLFSDWPYSGEDSADGLIRHYERLSSDLGFACRPEVGNVASRARTLMRKGDTAEAIKVFEYNARIHPRDPSTHAALGSAYRAAGHIQEAIAAFERALELRPGNEEISEILRELRNVGAVAPGGLNMPRMDSDPIKDMQ